MATASLWDEWKTAARARLKEVLTGQPAPNSIAALQQQHEREGLQRQLEQGRKPATPRTVAELLQDYEQISKLDASNRARDNSQQLAYIGAGSLLEAGDRLQQRQTTAHDAQALNDRQLVDSKAQAGIAMVEPHLANQIDMATIRSRDLEKFLAYGHGQTERILKAQQSAQTLPMIANILQTVAATASAFA